MTPSNDSKAVLREWRQKILNGFLVIAALAMVPACVLVVVDAMPRPDQWPAAEVFAALLLLLAVLAFWRRLDSRIRAGGLLVVGYVAAVLALARGGLAGTGRAYLLVLPILALILLGVRSGVLMSVLSALIIAAFAILADRGVLSLWLIDRENSVRLVDWISEGTYTLALLAAAMVLLALFHRFQVRTIDQEQRARAEADRAQELLEQHNATLERRVAERTDELREWEQRLADIIDFLPDATMAVDREGKVIIWNRAMEELAGVPAAEVLSKGNYEYSLRLYGERRPILIDLALLPAAEVEERYAYIRREGELLIGEAYVPLLRNEPAFLWGVASALHDSQGNVVGAIETIRDITERKKSEEALSEAKAEAEAATRAKSAFLATMSHEIRTPMNAIIGMTGLMLDTPLTREQREFAETIRFSGDALLTIINDILDFSKIEAGRMDLEQQPFLLRDCVEGAVDLLAAKVNEKGLNLACVIEPDTPPAIFGDVTRLRQILVNLLANAVKFTESGEVVVTVTRGEGDKVTGGQGPARFTRGQGDEAARDDLETPVTESLQSSPVGPGHQVTASPGPLVTESPDHLVTLSPGHQVALSPDHRVTESPGQVLHFAVRDTGVGITAEGMARLFQSFSQVDASTTRRFGGTGLGLAISKRLAELMGGTMWAESEGVPGRGSTFHFTIQARVAEVGPAIDRQAVQPNLQGKRVLIVDDNPTNRRILSLQAQSWGMVPCETGSPAEALAWLRREDQFALAFLDLHMPGMDGIELSAEIRKLRTEKQLPLVMLSSQARRETHVPEGRFAAFLSKPIKASQIYNVLVELFAGQAEPAAAQAPAQPQYDVTLGERHPLRLLLAEDNRINQKVALLMLGRLGYRADVAANGLEAMQSLRRQAYDVVLMDVQMPEMDGLEATRAIWREWPTAGRPRIVAMTANATEEDRAACLAAGMDDYLSKPILVEELVAALLRCSPNPGIAGTANQS